MCGEPHAVLCCHDPFAGGRLNCLIINHLVNHRLVIIVPNPRAQV